MQYRPMPNWIGAAIALSTTMGFPFILGLVRAFHAATRATAGDMTAMVEVMEGLAQAGQTVSQSGVPLMFGLVAEAHQALHQPADGLGAADVGLGISAQTSQGFWDGELHRVKGEPSTGHPSWRGRSDRARSESNGRPAGSKPCRSSTG